MQNHYPIFVGTALLAYMVLIILLFTFAPFEFFTPEKINFRWYWNPPDFVLNIFFFSPAGFLLRLASRIKGSFYWKEISFGLGLSLFIELTQSHIVGRSTNGFDIVANTAGALVGGLFFSFMVSASRDDGAFEISLMKLPLVLLVFLLVPQMWITCISAGHQPAWLLLLVPLAFFGAGLIAAIYNNRLAYGQAAGTTIFFTMAVWYFLSIIPAIMQHPMDTAYVSVYILAIFFLLIVFRRNRSTRRKRFEVRSLKRLFPAYLLYLSLLVLMTRPVSLAESSAKAYSVPMLFHLAAIFSGLTVLGFIIFEMRGRLTDPTYTSSALVTAISCILITLFWATGGLTYSPAKMIFISFILISAALYGGLLYKVHLNAIIKEREQTSNQLEPLKSKITNQTLELKN